MAKKWELEVGVRVVTAEHGTVYSWEFQGCHKPGAHDGYSPQQTHRAIAKHPSDTEIAILEGIACALGSALADVRRRVEDAHVTKQLANGCTVDDLQDAGGST